MRRLPGGRTTRKFFLAAIAVALAAAPGSAKTGSSMDCQMMDTWHGLFCNDGSDIMYCDNGGPCYVGCGQGNVTVECD